MGLAHFANARSIRNALDRARLRQANRLFARRGLSLTKADLVTIEGEDICGNGYAVAACGLLSLELLEAIMSRSERSRSPMIRSLTEWHFERYDFELAMAASERAARTCRSPSTSTMVPRSRLRPPQAHPRGGRHPAGDPRRQRAQR